MNKLFFDLIPAIAFFVVLKIWGIYWATAAAMIGGVAQIGWLKMRGQPVQVIHWLTVALLLVFGTLTIVLQDERFVKIKPTIIYLVMGAGMLIPQFIGKEPALAAIMSHAMRAPRAVWAKGTIAFAGVFALMAAINFYVAFHFRPDLPAERRTEIWAAYNAFGDVIVMLVCVLAITFWIGNQPGVEAVED